MKRIILTALFLTAFGIAGFSQTGVFSGVLGKPVKPLRETGLVIRPELGMVYDSPNLCIIGNVNMGYQFSPHFYAGGGCGLWGLWWLSESWLNLHDNNYVPLYASIRCYWFDKPLSPFVDFNAGYTRGDTNRRGCALFNFALGYDIKNFDIKIGALVTGQRDWNYGLFLTFGYNITIKKE